MKKIVAVILAFMMMLSLAACDTVPQNTDPSDPGSTTTQNPPPVKPQETTTGTTAPIPPTFDLSSVMMGTAATDVVWGKQDEATKQAIIAEGKKDGVDVSFGSEGSMTVVDPENGDTIVQNPDGTWTIKNDDGSEGQYGGNWPENEFTRLLPKPDMTLLAASKNEDEFTVGFQNATLDQVKSYVEQVKNAGFTLEAQTEDQNVMGMTIYTYTAKNAAGYTVTVSHVMGTSAVLLEKP